MRRFSREEWFHSEIPFYVGESFLPKEDFCMHTHEFSELFVILSGSGMNIIDGKEYEIKPGDVYVINGDVSHGFKNLDNLALYNIMYDPDFMLQDNWDIKKMAGYQSLFVLEPFYRKEHEFQSRLTLAPEKLKLIQGYATNLQKEFNDIKDGSYAVIKAFFMLIVVLLCREYENSPKNENIRQVLVIAEAVAYMEKNYKEQIKLETIASMAHLSVRHFSRIFSENYHMSPVEYMIRLRLEHSCDLLVSSDRKITEIADLSGFTDGNYFARLFKDKYGLTPKQYREFFC